MRPFASVDDVLIAFSRPASLGESEMRAWIAERARDRGPSLTLGGPDHDRHHVLRARMYTGGAETAEDQLTDLMLDMRLLGLRPSVLGAPQSEDGYEYR